jgi:hypothetical protein
MVELVSDRPARLAVLLSHLVQPAIIVLHRNHPSSLNVSTTSRSLMVVLLCPLPLLRQGVCFGCAPIAHRFSGATPSLCAAISTPARATCGRDQRPR